MDVDITAISFGYGHGEPPTADITFDARAWFRDPHVSPRMRHMTGTDAEVIVSVLEGSGGNDAIRPMLDMAAMLMGHADNVHRSVIVAVGCVGGRHRSVVLIDGFAERARKNGYLVTVMHRDLDKPVIKR